MTRGREQPLAEGDLFVAQRLLDRAGVEHIGEGQTGVEGEQAVQRADWAGARRRGTMSHGWPPFERGIGDTPQHSKAGHLL